MYVFILSEATARRSADPSVITWYESVTTADAGERLELKHTQDYKSGRVEPCELKRPAHQIRNEPADSIQPTTAITGRLIELHQAQDTFRNTNNPTQYG